jgi:hypothetical protein
MRTAVLAWLMVQLGWYLTAGLTVLCIWYIERPSR